MADEVPGDYVLIDRDNDETPELLENLIEIKHWLRPTDYDSPTSEYQKHLTAHVPGTGEWILDTAQYRRWFDTGDLGALWIRGIPGSGKSVVAASLIQRFKDEEDCPVLFFFFREIIVSNRTPRSLLRDFAWSLLPHSPRLQSHLRALMKDYVTVDDVPFGELWRCVSSSLEATRKVYCIVDALDEMDPGHGYFIRDLIDLSNRHPRTVKLILTSRQLVYLEDHLRDTSSLIDLRLDRRNVDQDIAKYITRRLSAHNTPFRPKDAASIKETIDEKGQGLFLYARLMMDQLLLQPENIMSQLAQLPDSLDTMYTRILQEHATLSGTTENFQRLVLQWITHSARPLRLLELATIIESLPDRGGLKTDRDAKLTVRMACGPLLELCEDGVIQVIHHSVTEFCRNWDIRHVQSLGHGSDSTQLLVSCQVHTHIAYTCINYLLNGCLDECQTTEANCGIKYSADQDIERKKKIQSFPFLQYAAIFWPAHAALADDSDTKLLAAMNGILEVNSPVFDAWKEFWTEHHAVHVTATPLHVAAYCGLAGYIRYIAPSGDDVNAVDGGEQTPLRYAAMAGHADCISALIQLGSEPDSVDHKGLAAAHYAAQKNHAPALRALIKGGADPLLPKSVEHHRFQSTVGRTPLFYACRYGQTEAFGALRESVRAQDLRQGALHWAAEAREPRILRTLLEDPDVRIGIDDWDSDGNTPLYLAAYSHRPAALKVLLDYGANIHAISEDRRLCCDKPLSTKPRRQRSGTKPRYAPIHGWARLSTAYPDLNLERSLDETREVLDLLVDAGCDVNARDHRGRTALFLHFILENVLEMITMLISHGADASLVDFDGNTPLHFPFCLNVDESLVTPLVAAGIDINAKRRTDDRTALMILAGIPSHASLDLEVFRAANANLEIQDKDGNTAAHHAFMATKRWPTWSSESIRAWAGIASPYKRNNVGQTALHTILSGIRKEHLSVVSLLVEQGFSLEARDNRGYTALLTLVSQHLVYDAGSFVAELLRLGANARATDYEGKSVLHHVVVGMLSYTDDSKKDVEEKLRIMRMLATAGADINAIDHAGNTIFHSIIACDSPWYHVHGSMRAAMEMGVPLAQRNHQGRSVVHLAVMVDEHYKSLSDSPSYGDSRMAFILNPELNMDVGAVDHEGVTPLHLASTASEINSWLLVQAGANIMARTCRGEMPLHFAARSGQCNIVGHFIELYQSRTLPVDFKSLNGRTALHEAARSGRPESVKLLLDAGADPKICDEDGRTPLHAAAEFQNQATIGPRDSYKPSISPYEDKPYTAARALHEMGMIIQNEDDTQDIREVVRLLLDAGANPAFLDKSEYTATDVALMLGNGAVVDALGPAMRSIYTNTPNAEGLAPLDPLGESLCSHASLIVATMADTVCIPDKYDDFLKRAISTRNEGLVEGLVRSRGLSLIQDNSASALCLAARWGLVPMMKKLIPYIEDLSVVYDSLMTAAMKRVLPNIEMVKFLLKHRGNQAEFQQSIRTAMRILTKGTHWWYASALTLLLEAGADPNAKDHHGETPLHSALEAATSPGTLRELQPGRMIEILLRHNSDANALSEDGHSPLSIAIQNRKTETVLKLLLDYGANALIGSPPAIFFAVDRLNIRVVKFFLETGIDLNSVFDSSEFHRSGKEAKVETLLECAACPVGYDLSRLGPLPRRESLISLLLEHGADPNLSICEGTSSPLHEISGMNGIVKPFIQKGCDLEQRDINGKTPLLRACKPHKDTPRRDMRHESAAVELIRGGANVHATDNDGFTPLHYASWFGLTDIVNELLQKSASANVKNNHGLTPLYYAFIDPRESETEFPSRVHHDIVTDLLDAGADPLERAPDDRTALHFIAPCLMDYRFTRGSIKAEDLENLHWPAEIFAKYSQLYLRFVEAGCDREARDSNGNTPIFAYVATDRIFHEEVETPYPPMVENIRSMFADHNVHALNDEGDTLLHIAARRGDEGKAIPGEPGIFELLVEFGLSPWVENKKGATALDTAAMWDRREILAIFSRGDELAQSSSTSESGI